MTTGGMVLQPQSLVRRSVRRDPRLVRTVRAPILRLVLGLLALSLGPAASGPAFAQASPVQPCSGAEHRALDFWLGEWNVVDETSGKLVGSNRIERLWSGCALFEQFTGADGFRGGSLIQWDPSSRVWRLTGGGSTGAAMTFEGAVTPQGLTLLQVSGSRIIRMTVNRLTNGQVRQASDASNDGGATWRSRYAYLYRPAT